MPFHFKVINCTDATFDGTYCEAAKGYFYNGSEVAGGVKYTFEKYGDSDKKIIFERYGTDSNNGYWILAENYDGFNDIAYIRSARYTAIPPTGSWVDCVLQTSRQCSSSSSSSSNSSSSNSFSSSSNSSSSSSSVDPYVPSAFLVSGMSSTSYNGTYCATNLTYYEKGTGYIRGGSRFVYYHRSNPLLAMIFINYSTGYWLLVNTATYNGANAAAYVSSSGLTPATGAWGSFCTVTATDCSSSSSSSNSSSNSSSDSSSNSSSNSSSDSSSNSSSNSSSDSSSNSSSNSSSSSAES